MTCTATTETILLCDGCFQAATGLLAECEDRWPSRRCWSWPRPATGAQRDALAAYVIRKLHNAWNTR